MFTEVEQLYYKRVLGIRKEFSGLNPIAAWLLMYGASRYVRKHQSVIEGSLPETGAAIITGNHFQEGDSLKTLYAGKVTASRLTSRTVVKMSLVKRGAYESEEYFRSIGKEEGDLDKHSRVKAFALRGAGVIPILRDNPDPGFANLCNEVLRSGQILGMFMQASRDKDCLLRNLQPGVAIFAMRHPNIPVYSIAFSGSPDGPDKISIRESFTYAQKKEEFGRKLSIAEFTILIADTIAEGLPERSRTDWITRRPNELEHLIILTSKRKTISPDLSEPTPVEDMES